MKLTVSVLVLVAAATLSACSSLPADHFADHAISIDRDGNIRVSRETRGILSNEKTSNSRNWKATLTSNFRDPINHIFAEAAKSGKNVLIFIHGGLNSISDSTERTNKFIELFDRSPELFNNYYPVFINWDSGLAGSYEEHLFRVRQGEIDNTDGIPLFAIVTSPIYFGVDLGRGVVQAPTDILFTAEQDLSADRWIAEN